MGATAHGGDGADETFVSIHAPVMGATKRALELEQRFIVSIHAPVMGATISNSDAVVYIKFQSTRP